jgi:peptidoglycan hydrolase-like protein with peptidoglycan-binding domain
VSSPQSKTVYLALEQTLTTVAVALFTDESTSRSIAGSVANVPGRGWVLSYTYLNTPRIERREASPIHYGGALLAILDGGGITIDGEYWNDRASKGRLVFRKHAPEVARSIEHAASMAWRTETPNERSA